MKQFEYSLISDRTLYDLPLWEVAAKAEKSGVHNFHLREKDLTPRELLSLAEKVRLVLHRTRMIIHGCLDVALACRADGVHLQKSNVPVSAVRSKYPELRLGYSAHSFEEMKKAEEEGADYVFISPIFQPRSKQSDFSPYGTSALKDWSGLLKIPFFALGGISRENLMEIKQTGCRGVAGISLFVQDRKFTSAGMVV